MDLDPQGNEVHHLTGRNLSSSIPLHQRDEWWIRWPASFAHTVRLAVVPTWARHQERQRRRPNSTRLADQVWDWTKGDIFHVLLLALPFAIAAGAAGWSPRAVFSLGVLASAGLEAIMTSSVERCCLSLGHRAAGFCADAITNITPTSTSIVALLMNQNTVARDIVIGSAMANILVGTGATLFVGCLTVESKTVGDAARDIGRITLLGAAPIIFPLTIKLAYRYADKAVAAQAPANIASISHGTTAIMLFVYLPWLFFRRSTHRERFSAQDTAGALLGSRLTHARHVRVSARALAFWAAVAAASFAANIFVARYVVGSIAPLVGEDGAAFSSTFLSIIVIPLAINCSNYVKATMLARGKGVEDVSLSVYVTFGAAVGNIAFSLPLLLIIAWGTARPLGMDLPGAQAFTLVGSIWETFIVLGTGRVNYLNGLTCLCLYTIIALGFYYSVLT